MGVAIDEVIAESRYRLAAERMATELEVLEHGQRAVEEAELLLGDASGAAYT